MKAAISTVLVVLACVFRLSAQQSSGGQLPTMFVAPLEGDSSQVMGWQPALGDGLAEMLITELSKLGKFQMVESTALKDLAEEIKLGESGYVNQQEKVDKGGWAGADFMFRGKVTRFGSNQNKVGLGGFVPGNFGNLGVKLTTSDVRIDWRVVDVYNRRVIKTGSATASQKGGGFDVGTAVNGNGGRIGFDNQEFMNSALGKATVKAVTMISQDMSGLNLPASGRSQTKMQAAQQQQAASTAASTALRQTPGTVLAVVNKNTLIVSVGSKQGFKPGDKLNLLEKVDTKDDKGTVVFSEEKPAGEIVLDVVQEDKSKATYNGTADVKASWTVRAK